MAFENLLAKYEETPVAYFIITQNHAGEMSVESESGKGARFIIKLPV